MCSSQDSVSFRFETLTPTSSTDGWSTDEGSPPLAAQIVAGLPVLALLGNENLGRIHVGLRKRIFINL